MAPFKRHAYDAEFKLKAVSYAAEHGNRAAAREFNINESMVRKWRKQEDDLCQVKKTKKSFRGNKARWPQLEDKLEQWVVEQTAASRSVSTVTIRMKATALAQDMNIDEFHGGPSWCFRFMKRRNLSIRTRTTVSQQLPKDYQEKLATFRAYYKNKITEKKIRPEHITNMDEVPLTFDIPVNRTVEKTGTSTVSIRTTGNEKSSFKKSTMSELFMECVEEELEPWQKQVPEVQLIDDDDDEPIFVGVLSNNQKDGKPNPPPPPQRNSAAKQETKHSAPQPIIGSSQIMLPLSLAGKAMNNAANLSTVTPQPVIVNNQGFIVTSPQLANNSEFIASLGSHYPPGTSFTIVPAAQQHLFQQVTSAAVMPGAVHRPQVQQISNNIVTLSNVQTPAVYSAQSHQIQLNRSLSQSLQTFSVPVKAMNNNRDQSLVKRLLPPQQMDSAAKRARIDFGTQKAMVPVENGIFKKKCQRCQEEFLTQEALKFHMVSCCAIVESPAQSALNIGANKRIMLVSEFYYGRFEGDGNKKEAQKPNTTFKCQSCLKVLKNNIRFMNHMKHHLELEKQNSESWESHTTCQHCYRQYMTPFQLQCHIESAHSPIESSTNCKICELAFESEQVLLEHMKDNHKPGEMPYICQVCNYRSSFFSEVETHFRSVHENTKDLLCPFCLKVLRSSHIYMQHYMKHQKKGIHRCGKCRLNFLTYKERVEHRTHFHKTFRKPKALEGLPPGTKVTIRASLAGKTPTFQTSPDQSGFIVGSESFNQQTKPPVGVSKSKSNSSGAGKAKTTQSKKQDGRTTKHNQALRNLRVNGGWFTCIECNTQVDDFFSHFPMFSNCGACKYRTSCKVSIGNHMIRFHSTITKNRFLKMDHKKNFAALKLTLVCLNCDLLVDASGGDLMTKHLTDRPNHICKVIQEKGNSS